VKLVIFALIPLILSIGITPIIPFSDAVESNQICIDKVWIENSKGKIACVTSSTADKLVQRGWGTILSDDVIDETSEITFEIPPYPDQPSIHPKLLATNDYWSPPTVHKVTDGVYTAVGFDAANSIMIEGNDGIIIVDTLSTYEAAKKVISEFRKITDKPVKAIIYTHGHLDHVHGTSAFLEEGEDIEIYAHDSHVDFYINENSVLGPGATTRSIHAAGAMLPSDGPDARNMGVFPPMIPGTIAYVAPTQTFSDELEVEISGVKIKMVFVAGESSDQIYVWLPEKEVLLTGDNAYAVIPNIYTLRGAVYRDPMNYVNALDQMIPLDAEYLVASHNIPVIGKENVRDILVSIRDATQYLNDQTIRGMNAGYTADELSRMIELPENLDNHPWLTKARNDVSAHVKQIYYGNFGWFEGNSAFLNAVSLEERSHKIVDGFGGVTSSISLLQVAIDDEEYEWAAELGTYILNVEPDNEDVKLLTAHVLRVLSYSSEGMDERHWLLTDALELEGKITIDPKSFTQSSPEQMAELPIEKIIRFLPTKLNPQKAAGMDTVLGVTYSDTGMDFTFHVRNSILAVTDGTPNNPDMTLILDSDTHKLIVGGHLKVLDAIQSGQAELTGNVDDLVEFLNLFDNVSLRTS
jgi:alkyl sulfatase BDS1-like metallo-beta-lactamase superfamily hydrolase